MQIHILQISLQTLMWDRDIYLISVRKGNLSSLFNHHRIVEVRTQQAIRAHARLAIGAKKKFPISAAAVSSSSYYIPNTMDYNKIFYNIIILPNASPIVSLILRIMNVIFPKILNYHIPTKSDSSKYLIISLYFHIQATQILNEEQNGKGSLNIRHEILLHEPCSL